MSDRDCDVRKTYKLYIGGKFPRSESGRSYEVTDRKGRFLANAAMASRKDARDAVVAARKAFPGWSAATAYNRGQVLYRVAELLEGRRGAVRRRGRRAARASRAARPRPPSTRRSTAGSGTPAGRTRSPRCTGSANPVAGPYFDFSVPEPTGVVAVLAPQESSLLGLVSVVAPAIVTGNTVVVLSQRAAAAAGGHAVRGARDLRRARRRRQRADRAHRRGRALAGLAHGRQRDRPRRCAGRARVTDLEVAAADNLKRVLRPERTDWAADARTSSRMLAYLETKTVWHPIGV